MTLFDPHIRVVHDHCLMSGHYTPIAHIAKELLIGLAPHDVSAWERGLIMGPQHAQDLLPSDWQLCWDYRFMVGELLDLLHQEHRDVHGSLESPLSDVALFPLKLALRAVICMIMS